MLEPFAFSESDEMTRALHAANTDVPSAAPALAQAAAAGKPLPAALVVCPFCGMINEASLGPCKQCGLENSQTTRNATRAKLGPWYVWQARNPSAPGMNFQTLLQLIAKGRVTARSVMRGPTTQQLWRYAARVKGVSREFGVCWGCGGEVQKTAKVCPSCKRMQLPPFDPDELLDHTTDGQQSAYAKAQTPGGGALSGAAITGSEPELVVLDRTGRPAPFVDVTEGEQVSGVEMAAYALPRNYALGALPRPRRRVLRAVAVALLSACGAVGISIYLHPELKDTYAGWGRSLMTKVSPSRDAALPDHSVPPTLDARLAVEREDTAPAGSGLESVTASPSGNRKAAEVRIGVGPAQAPDGAARTPTSMDPAAARVGSQVNPDNAADVLGTSKIGQIEIAPKPLAPEAAERKAWELRDLAIKAEQRHDYAAAIKDYEAIQSLRLAEGVGPQDVESRLARAKSLLPINGR